MSRHLHEHKAATGRITTPDFEDGYLAGWEDREARLPTRDEVRDEFDAHHATFAGMYTDTCDACGERIGHTDPDGNDRVLHQVDAIWHRMVDVDLDTGAVDYNLPDLTDSTRAVLAVLRVHRRKPDAHGRPVACRCGFATSEPGYDFDAHLADAIVREGLSV